MKDVCGPRGGNCKEDGLSSAAIAVTHISSLPEARRGRMEMENNSRIQYLRRALCIKFHSQSSTSLCEVHKLEGILKKKEERRAINSLWHRFPSTSRHYDGWL